MCRIGGWGVRVQSFGVSVLRIQGLGLCLSPEPCLENQPARIMVCLPVIS